MRFCKCGHSEDWHVQTVLQIYECEMCDCDEFEEDKDYEPADDPEAWAGGFAENH